MRLFGFINAFKPPGISSAAFGNWVKHRAGVAVGHWGTLDPSACGVLVLALGKATKLLTLIGDARKRYVFELVAGEQTDSGDATGTVIAQGRVSAHWQDGLALAAASLLGPNSQIPPMHSAVKVGGRPLYERARAGETVARAPRLVTIYELRMLGRPANGPAVRLAMCCDAGTYVRVVCEELGRILGMPARMGSLLRVASGPFSLRDSVAPHALAAGVPSAVIDPLAVLAQPRVHLDDSAARRFCFGNAVPAQPLDAAQVLVLHDGRLIGVGRMNSRDGASIVTAHHVLADE